MKKTYGHYFTEAKIILKWDDQQQEYARDDKATAQAKVKELKAAGYTYQPLPERMRQLGLE